MSDQDRLVAGRYRLTRQLGRGGMGTVWLASDALLDRQVAVKKLRVPAHLEDDDRARLYERTRREARSAARISHPSVIIVHDVVEDDGLPCIVMEYVPSRSLSQVLKEDGPLSPERVAGAGLAMASALRAAHGAGVLHRDVKPANVLLSAPHSAHGAHGGRTVLTDFGIAAASGTSTLTRTGEFVGSIDYAAPERMQGGVSGPAADVWALGATLYEAVEGKPPFRRDTWVETAYATASEPPQPMERAGALAPLIERLLEKEPGERPTLEEAEAMLSGSTATVASGGAAAATRPEGTGSGAPAGAEVLTAGPAEPATATTGAQRRTTVGGGNGAEPTLATGRHPRRRGRALAWAVTVAVVGCAAATGGWWFARDSTATPATSAASPSTAPSGSASPSPSRPATPEGYHRVQDPLGFSVDVPDGWHRQATSGEQADYIAPSGRTGLKFSVLDFADTSPLHHWRQLEPEVRAKSPGYERLRMNATAYQGEPAAIWEYTWQGRVRPYHVVDLGFGKVGETQYAIYLSAPDAEWDAAKPYFDVAAQSFRVTE
ncbi:serine/threonine-protein kinase [Streptomyces daliensis]|uniref:non-specific serine/threonine protein kinase n=1 Tax=Streptomyces daliensis TaxID=299421 RepID=A0A8T4J1X6_9ACTN|nr:protein kinase [Streptomyces daliensis]